MQSLKHICFKTYQTYQSLSPKLPYHTAEREPAHSTDKENRQLILYVELIRMNVKFLLSHLIIVLP